MGGWALCRAVGVMVDMTMVVLLSVCYVACDERARLSSIVTKGKRSSSCDEAGEVYCSCDKSVRRFVVATKKAGTWRGVIVPVRRILDLMARDVVVR